MQKGNEEQKEKEKKKEGVRRIYTNAQRPSRKGTSRRIHSLTVLSLV
jgi:hypothetical protein